MSVRPRQWADQYGSSWYLHKDGKPPLDDDSDYVWRHGQWVTFEEAFEEDEVE